MDPLAALAVYRTYYFVDCLYLHLYLDGSYANIVFSYEKPKGNLLLGSAQGSETGQPGYERFRPKLEPARRSSSSCSGWKPCDHWKEHPARSYGVSKNEGPFILGLLIKWIIVCWSFIWLRSSRGHSVVPV